MSIIKAYAVVCTANLASTRAWYEKLFGRVPDVTPMEDVHEWHFGDGGVQLVDEAGRAGQSMLTLMVDDLDSVRRLLGARGLRIGPTEVSAVATIAQIQDPDGNVVTLAQPGPAQQPAR